MSKRSVHLSLDPGTVAAVSLRGENLSAAVRRDLGRLYESYRLALQRLPLTLADACAICEALDGVPVTPAGAAIVPVQVERMLRAAREPRWAVSPELVRILEHAPTGTLLAVADATERAALLRQRRPALSLEDAVTEAFGLES